MRIVLAALILAVSATAFAQEPVEAPGATATPSEEALLLAADEIGAKVGEIRGLPLLRPVKKGIKKREELRSVLLEKLAEDVADSDIEAEAAVFKRLGVLPQDFDYKEVLLDLLSEQIAGFYDTSTEELYVMDGMAMEIQRPVMAHELFHAVQDQHFDIDAMRAPFTTQEHSDFALARAALLEGDATVLLFDFQMYETGDLPTAEATSFVDMPLIANTVTQLNFDSLMSMGAIAGAFGGGGESVEASVLASVPLFIRESLMFPYFAGLRFVVRSRSQRAWVDVDEVYKSPPVSTEQILHPEKYYAGEEPEWLDFDVSAALPGYQQIYDSVIGEFQMGHIFKAHPIEQVVPGDAVAGWDGDRAFAYRSPEGATTLVHLTAWDTVEEAQEYYDALTALSQHRYPETQFARSSGTYGQSSCGAIPNSERLYIEQWGDLVLHIEGAPSAINADGVETNGATFYARDLAWGTLKRTPFAEVLAKRISAQKEKAAK